MLSRYEKFLKDFDEIIKSIFEDQKRYIKCKKGKLSRHYLYLLLLIISKRMVYGFWLVCCFLF